MPEENPLDQLMHEMRKIIKQIDENSDKIFSEPLNSEADKKIGAWEKSVNALISDINKTVKETGIPPQLIHEIREEIPEALTADERETLKRMKLLKDDIESLQKDLKQKKASLGDEESLNEEEPKDPPESRQKGSRKSKFKRMGGDTWKPV